jgi:hypothetical protein
MVRISRTGQPDGTPGAEPMKCGVAFADIFAGLYATIAITAALMGWLGLAVTIWYISNRFMCPPASHVDVEPLLRGIGFASAPVAHALGKHPPQLLSLGSHTLRGVGDKMELFTLAA